MLFRSCGGDGGIWGGRIFGGGGILGASGIFGAGGIFSGATDHRWLGNDRASIATGRGNDTRILELAVGIKMRVHARLAHDRQVSQVSILETRCAPVAIAARGNLHCRYIPIIRNRACDPITADDPEAFTLIG